MLRTTPPFCYTESPITHSFSLCVFVSYDGESTYFMVDKFDMKILWIHHTDIDYEISPGKIHTHTYAHDPTESCQWFFTRSSYPLKVGGCGGPFLYLIAVVLYLLYLLWWQISVRFFFSFFCFCCASIFVAPLKSFFPQNAEIWIKSWWISPDIFKPRYFKDSGIICGWIMSWI